MTIIEEKAARYRCRAKELRVLAEDWSDHRAQAMILEIAADYERMARTVGSLRVISSNRTAAWLPDPVVSGDCA